MSEHGTATSARLRSRRAARVPGGRLADEDEHPVAAVRSPRAQQVRPAGRVDRESPRTTAGRRSPSASTKVSAPRVGSAASGSTTSRAKLKCSGTSQPVVKRRGGLLGASLAQQRHQPASPLSPAVLPALAVVLAHGLEDVEHERALGAAVRRSARRRRGARSPPCGPSSCATRRPRRAPACRGARSRAARVGGCGAAPPSRAANSIRLSIAPLAEERPPGHAVRERERPHIVEADELSPCHRLASVTRTPVQAHVDCARRYRQRVATIATDLLRHQAYVDGAWVDADSGATFPVREPGDGGDHRGGAAAGRRRDAARDRGGPASAARLEGATGQGARARAPAPRRPDGRARGRARDAARARAGQAARRGAGRDRLRASFYEWFGEEAKRLDGRDDPAPWPDKRDRRHARADRGDGGHHAVELPGGDADPQVGARARRRLHDGAQAGGADAALRARDRRPGGGGRCPAGCLLGRHRRCGGCALDRRRDDVEPDRPQARLHRARRRWGSSSWRSAPAR